MVASGLSMKISWAVGIFSLCALFTPGSAWSQNRDPLTAGIITDDVDRFWVALEKAGPEVNPEALEEYYLKPGSIGVKGFTKGRIQNASNLAAAIRSHQKYYNSIRPSLDSLNSMKDAIRASFVRLKELYPDAIFPPVYFVVGALSSGGTSTHDALVIGAEMYGRTAGTPKEELNDWLRAVIKPVGEVPHIVAHELIHFQQKYDGGVLLAAAIKEGAADFIGELISGKNINQHVHDFANPREKALWLEFKERMDKKDYSGWLYSPAKDRPNDLGYWMGYKITESYYHQAADKSKAVSEILHIKNFNLFLEQSGYEGKFDKP